MNQQTFKHLPYLDGLRGLAALYVVLHHAYMEVVEKTSTSLPLLAKLATGWLFYGQVAVDIFIVLSGYCLMLPIALAGGKLRGGISQYLKRRARRILPPYYAAMLLSLLMIAAIPGMNQEGETRWNHALPALDLHVITSHLLLIHNWHPDWIHGINPPMWSVATEWQIYFLFPLLLLPIWKRFGSLITVVVAVSLGLAPRALFQVGNAACPWFLGLFAFGMVAAVINVSPPISSSRLRNWSGTFYSLGGVLFLGITIVLGAERLWSRLYLMDILVGLTTACLLILCTSYCFDRAESSHPWFLRSIASPYPVLLGSFSYSLYLVHFPVLSLFHLWILPFDFTSIEELVLLLIGGTLLSLVVSYMFHLLIERRFMKIALQPVK